MENIIVSKFGGSSLSDAKQFDKVKNIICSKENRSYIVVSAPGKRFEDDIKITDMLNSIHTLKLMREELISKVKERFEEICDELSLSDDLKREITNVCSEIEESTDKDFVLSRGEYLNALLMGSYLGYEFVDSKDLIFFDENGNLDEDKTYLEIKKKISKKGKIIVPGFYGSNSRGNVKTFERGGSDITGSIIARGINADLYENWTDVTGVMTADPKKEKNAKTIRRLTYKELLQITQNGAQVYHPDAIRPVENAHIPINIKNTNNPEEIGTLVKGED